MAGEGAASSSLTASVCSLMRVDRGRAGPTGPAFERAASFPLLCRRRRQELARYGAAGRWRRPPAVFRRRFGEGRACRPPRRPGGEPSPTRVPFHEDGFGAGPAEMPRCNCTCCPAYDGDDQRGSDSPRRRSGGILSLFLFFFFFSCDRDPHPTLLGRRGGTGGG